MQTLAWVNLLETQTPLILLLTPTKIHQNLKQAFKEVHFNFLVLQKAVPKKAFALRWQKEKKYLRKRYPACGQR